MPPLSLTRRRVGRFHRIVNRGPAKCYSLPDTDRQGRGCARGAGLRGAGGSVGMSCVRFALVLRFWRGVLCSSCACHTFLLECLLRLIYACRAALSECLMFDHACCLPHGAKQDGLREAAFLFRRRSGSPLARSRIGDAVIGHGGFTSGLRVSLWRSRRRTKGRGGRSRRRGRVRFCVTALAL